MTTIHYILIGMLGLIAIVAVVAYLRSWVDEKVDEVQEVIGFFTGFAAGLKEKPSGKSRRQLICEVLSNKWLWAKLAIMALVILYVFLVGKLRG